MKAEFKLDNYSNHDFNEAALIVRRPEKEPHGFVELVIDGRVVQISSTELIQAIQGVTNWQ